jgi:long-chain acyl-CoA synthetase
VGVIDDRKELKRIEILVAALHLASHIEAKSQTQNVGVMLPTSGAFPVAALACWMLGRTLVPLNYLFRQTELQYVIDDCGTDIVITAGPMLDFLGYEPEVKTLVRMDEMSFKGFPDVRLPARARDEDIAVVLYTSGTSGKPKGVLLSHGNFTANVRQAKQHARFTGKTTLLGVLPQFHSFGLTILTILPLTMGNRVIYTSRFVPQQIVKLIKKHQPHAFIGIPSMYGALLKVKNAGPADFRSLRYAVSGAEPLPDDISQRFYERFEVRISEGYGLTETSPVTNLCQPWDFKPHSVGPCVPELECIIVDPESDKVLPPESEGEIRFRGPNVMQGYYKLEEETKNAFDERGYFRTGDIGKFDRDGHLFITGRLKEMMIVGGENVFPREIEEVLNHHPSVHASAVIGRSCNVRGELPVAFVELEEGAEFDEAALKSHCKQSLAGYKIPREIRVLDELPRNPTGKIMRRALGPIIEADAMDS